MSPKSKAIYNEIGKTYDTTRKADPAIAKELYKLLNPHKNGRYLDIGCGSGNYTCALAEKGLQMMGADISSAMLAKAKAKNSAINWIECDARTMPFEDNSFDGAISVLATHHIYDLGAAMKEIYRVLKPGSSFIIFTTTPEQMKDFWLWHYFPKIMAASSNYMQSLTTLKQLLTNAHFKAINSIPFAVTTEVQDLFLFAGKFHPKIYLDPAVRAGISSFTSPNMNDAEEQEIGVAALKADINSGKIEKVIVAYGKDASDYLFIQAKK